MEHFHTCTLAHSHTRSVILCSAPFRSVWPLQGTICDIGGGIGYFAAEVLRHYPGATALVLDLPKTARESQQYLGQLEPILPDYALDDSIFRVC